MKNVKDLRIGDEFGYPGHDPGRYRVRVVSWPYTKRDLFGREMVAFKAEVVDRRTDITGKPDIGDVGELTYGPKAEIACS